jgi:hypothetical protein
MNFVNIAAGILVIFTVLAGVDMFRHFWGRRRARKAQERAESLQQRFVAAQGAQLDRYVNPGGGQPPVTSGL